MSKRIPEPTNPPRERAFLVGVEIHPPEPDAQSALLSLEDSLTELTLLADTAGLEVVGQATQKIDRPNPNTLIGSGKVEEIRALAEETLAQVVLFDSELNPRHQRELETLLGPRLRVLDRTALILDIFAQHAHTAEGILQVQLAQAQYYLPRLTGQWTHLARQAGGRAGSVGGVGLRGPGETQLEIDRREIRRKIAHLKSELEKVRQHRLRYRAQRKRSQIPTVALVGYTNAGKSTLLNRLARAEVFAANQLFATLDPTTRRVELAGGQAILLTDTVGFIQKLPTTLVAAFRATLEEISEADLLLHVVDISHPNALAQFQAVQSTLQEIGATHIPSITALNKADRLPDPALAAEIASQFAQSIAISALKGQGIGALLEMVRRELYENYVPIDLWLPYSQGQLISLVHQTGQIQRVEHGRGGMRISGRVPGRLVAQLREAQNASSPAAQETKEHDTMDFQTS